METNASVSEMTETSPSGAQARLALIVLTVALGLGALGDAMLRAAPWGMNLAVCTAALALSAAVMARRFNIGRASVLTPMLALAVLFALGCALRDSATLKALDVLAVMLTLALAVWHAQGGSLVFANVSTCLRGVCAAAVRTLFGALGLVFRDVAWTRLPCGAWRRAASALVGILLALPLLVVFGGLLAAADAVFEQWVMIVLDIDFATVVSHVLLTGLLACLAAGYLRALLLQQRLETPPRMGALSLSLGSIEMGMVLGCLNLLFLAFVVVQFRHLFGGSAQVQVVPGLTYAAYARRGFFELVTVAALVLPLLLAADWLLRKEARKTVFRVLASALVVLLFVIMASAVQRMRMYQHEYGLTELRLYTTAFMAWLAVVFVWFAATVLRGRRERFVFGALVAAGAATVALHVANPDALIVEVNVAHARTGRPFDAVYAASLSADATPALLKALPKLTPTDQDRIVAALRKKCLDENGDWRNWNWSRAEAQRLIGERAASGPIQCREISGERR